MKFLVFALLLLNINLVKGDCVDINSTSILNIFNTTYNEDCYKHTIEHDNCCDYIVTNQHCRDTYIECVDHEKFILDNLKDHCHNYNDSMLNLSYHDECHTFTLNLEPYCCDNLLQESCADWYTQCHTFNETFNQTCNIPTSYRNSYCSNFTKHINHDCCDDFTTHCDQIYDWCINNNPNETGILDFFVGPRNGYTIGTSIMVYENTDTIEDCATYCFDTYSCLSFDYFYNTKHCHINKHMLGDIVNGQIVNLVYNQDFDARYYEKKHDMPFHDSLCNIKNDHWLGDGICDKNGGYNTYHCGYDGGDCCKQSCDSIYCGLLGYNCIDYNYNPIYTPTFAPTIIPTLLPTMSPSRSPTSSPTSQPTTSPTIYPTLFPTNKPTLSPTYEPTVEPNLDPTNKPTFNPTDFPTIKIIPTNLPTSSPIVRKSSSNSNSSNISPEGIGLIVVCLLAVISILGMYLLMRKNTIAGAETRTRTRYVSGINNPSYQANDLNTQPDNLSVASQMSDNVNYEDEDDIFNEDGVYDDPEVSDGIYDDFDEGAMMESVDSVESPVRQAANESYVSEYDNNDNESTA